MNIPYLYAVKAEMIKLNFAGFSGQLLKLIVGAGSGGEGQW